MRVITGKYKGRSFEIPHSFKARPTTDFAKENLFNVLRQYIDFDDSVALDLFSGTGSISLELLSRGCSKVVSIEMDKDHHKFITTCLQKLNESNCMPIRTDVFKFVKTCRQQFDFVFADPPYQLKELTSLPDLVLPLVKEDGLFVLEHGKDHQFNEHPNFIEHRAYGSVNFSFFRKN